MIRRRTGRAFARITPVVLIFSTLSALSITLSASAAGSTQPTITQAIDQVAVKGRAPKTGYSRSQFGQTWADVNRNGCDTRNDILKRDLVSIVFKVGTHECLVLSGVLHDPYSGTDINFVRGQTTSSLVQIDHIVALSNAWQTGAFQLTLIQRTALANDPLNLFAVKGSLNSQKGDGDAATWLPPQKSFRCEYVAHQVAVKHKYGLWFTKPEKEAILRVLGSCPNQELPK
ncbi:MAG: HNH endonuclease family protein [Actinomycetota bacterium]